MKWCKKTKKQTNKEKHETALKRIAKEGSVQRKTLKDLRESLESYCSRLTLKLTKTFGSLEAKYKEMNNDSKPLHCTVYGHELQKHISLVFPLWFV